MPSSTGNTTVMIDRVAGMMNAPPTPMNARADELGGAVRHRGPGPGEHHQTELERHRPAETVTEARRPSARAREHEDVAVDHPLQLAVGGLRSRTIVGMATFSTVLSSTMMSRLRHNTARIDQRRS
jgi:hypothetical protein